MTGYATMMYHCIATPCTKVCVICNEIDFIVGVRKPAFLFHNTVAFLPPGVKNLG